MSNKVQVDIEVTGAPQGEASFKRTAQSAKDAAREIAAAGGSFDDLFSEIERGGKLSADAADQLENLVAQSTLSGRAAKEAAAAYREETRAVEKLRQELAATEAEASKLQRELAARGNAPASRAAAELARQARRGGEGLDGDPVSLGRAGAFQRGTAQRELQALREEAKGVAREADRAKQSLAGMFGGAATAKQVISGLLGGELITAAVQGIVELVNHYRELRREDKQAREQLIRTAKDVGASIEQEVAQVERLAQSYKGLTRAVLDSIQAVAIRANRTPVTEQTVLEGAKQTSEERERLASLRVPNEAVSRAAIDVATSRGLRDQETLDKGKAGFFASVFGAYIPSFREQQENLRREATAQAAKKSLAELQAGNTQPLLGVSDAEVQARYAGVFNKLPSNFTEEERQTARRVELLRQASGAYVSAEEAVRRYRESLKGLRETERTAAEAATAAEIERLQRVKEGREKEKQIRDDFWKWVAQRDAERAAEEAKAEAERQAAMKAAHDSAFSLFKEVSQLKGRDNPFVSLYGEAAEAARSFEETSARLRARFGEDADALIEKLGEMTEAKRAALGERGAEQRFEDQLNALSLRQEAESIRNTRPPALEVKTQTAQTVTTPGTAMAAATVYRDSYFNPGSPFVRQPAAVDSPFAYIGPDSPFAPRTPEQSAELAARAEFLRAKDSGRIVADFATAYADAGTGAAAAPSRSVENARAIVERIRQLEAEEVSSGRLDSATARRVANEQILKRVRGAMSAEDLASNPDLRDLVSGALDFKAGGLENREQEAKALREAEATSRKELIDALNGLTGAVKTGRVITVEVKSSDVKADVVGRAY